MADIPNLDGFVFELYARMARPSKSQCRINWRLEYHSVSASSQ